MGSQVLCGKLRCGVGVGGEAQAWGVCGEVHSWQVLDSGGSKVGGHGREEQLGVGGVEVAQGLGGAKLGHVGQDCSLIVWGRPVAGD